MPSKTISFEEFEATVKTFFSLIDSEAEVKTCRVTNDREVLYESELNFNAIQYTKVRDWRFLGNGAVGRGDTLLSAFANYSVLSEKWLERQRLEALVLRLGV